MIARVDADAVGIVVEGTRAWFARVGSADAGWVRVVSKSPSKSVAEHRVVSFSTVAEEARRRRAALGGTKRRNA